ncbi:hypothetical protein D5S19_00010 [Amycolatopsis panacis]|uniref:Uncharacterized protein n=1 Tax=Amycolatopsis panacis TaxID=2340917 RepID=A0A419IBV1_9PSEU|nr:hypothetical protein D5S19_00010 [Amycolatopsis panacis]
MVPPTIPTVAPDHTALPLFFLPRLHYPLAPQGGIRRSAVPDPVHRSPPRPFRVSFDVAAREDHRRGDYLATWRNRPGSRRL